MAIKTDKYDLIKFVLSLLFTWFWSVFTTWAFLTIEWHHRLSSTNPTHHTGDCSCNLSCWSRPDARRASEPITTHPRRSSTNRGNILPCWVASLTNPLHMWERNEGRAVLIKKLSKHRNYHHFEKQTRHEEEADGCRGSGRGKTGDIHHDFSCLVAHSWDTFTHWYAGVACMLCLQFCNHVTLVCICV